MAKTKSSIELERSREMSRIEREMREAHVAVGKSMALFCVLVAEYMDLALSEEDRKFFVNNLMYEFDMDKSSVYRCERCGKASKALDSGQWPQLPANDSQLRPLARLLKRGPAVIQAAWKKALSIARKADEPMTASFVQEAVDDYLPIEAVTKAAADSPRLPSMMEMTVRRSVRRLEQVVTELNEHPRTRELAARIETIRVDLSELAGRGPD